MSKQINIDEDKIQNTQIVVTVKTLWTIVGVIVLGVSTLFGVLQSNLSAAKESLEEDIKTINTTQQKTNEDIKSLIDKLELRKVDPLDKQVEQIDKEVFLLMNRTNSRHTENTNGNLNTARMDTTFRPISTPPNNSPE